MLAIVYIAMFLLLLKKMSIYVINFNLHGTHQLVQTEVKYTRALMNMYHIFNMLFIQILSKNLVECVPHQRCQRLLDQCACRVRGFPYLNI